MQEEQQKSVKLHQENQKLKSALRPRNDPTIGPVERLKNDYTQRTDTMDDDLSFIQEVMAGASTAIPEFNAEMVRPSLPVCSERPGMISMLLAQYSAPVQAGKYTLMVRCAAQPMQSTWGYVRCVLPVADVFSDCHAGEFR